MKQLRLLIARIDRIGDVVLSTPIPREVKRRYPESFISVLVREYTKDIYINNPYVDEILIYDKTEPFFTTVKKLRKYKFTHAFILLPNERLSWLFLFSGIPYRVGVGHKLYQFLTFMRYVDRKKYIPLRHEADYCMDMVRKIGIEPKSIEPEIHLTEEEKRKSFEFKYSLVKNNNYLIGINVTSGKSAPNLPVDEYKKLIFELKKDSRFKIVVTDVNLPEEIQNIDGVVYPNLNNRLRDSIINIAALDLLISSSTGPMHIASALKVQTLSLFCPIPGCSPKLWGPLGNDRVIIMPEEHFCKTQCPIDPHKCNFMGDGGIDHKKILKEVYKIFA